MNSLKNKLTKHELIEKINNALFTEVNALAVYSRHIKTVLSFSDISPENRKKIREHLDLLIKESEDHKKTLTSIMEELKRRIEDVC